MYSRFTRVYDKCAQLLYMHIPFHRKVMFCEQAFNVDIATTHRHGLTLDTLEDTILSIKSKVYMTAILMLRYIYNIHVG